MHIKFCTNNRTCVNQNIGYNDKTTEEVETTNFLGLQIDNNLNWKTCVQYTMPKWSSVCSAVSAVMSHMKTNFKTSLVCLLPFHHIIWNNFGGKSNTAKKNYIQKRNIRIMAATKRRASCMKLFKKFNILSLASEFLLSLLLSFVVDNRKISY
jgi:hypothetical protein